MTKTSSHLRSAFFGSFSQALGLFVLLILMSVSVAAQTVTHYSPTSGSTPVGLAPGRPAGSYALSDFDTINPYNSSLSFHLPLLNVGGRGGAGYTIMLPIERKWRINKTVNDPTIRPCGPGGCEQYPITYSINAVSDWWYPQIEDFRPGIMGARWSGYDLKVDRVVCGDPYYLTALTRLSFIAADGTEYEFRDKHSGGKPLPVPSCSQGAWRGREFVSADGTSATFISDTDIYDAAGPLEQDAFGIVSGYLVMRDGTRYRIDDGQVSWMRDRNGNVVRFTAGKIIDALNREVDITQGGVSEWATYKEIQFNGADGVERTIRVEYDSLANALRPANEQHPEETIKTYGDLFRDISDWGENNNGGTDFLTKVISAVVLPDGRSYRFYYNSYGELARVELPTGGAFEYDWSGWVANMGGGADGPSYDVFRYVQAKRVYKKDDELESQLKLGACTNTVVPFGESCRQVDQLDANDNLLERTRHFYYGVPATSKEPIHYSYWAEGKEYKTESLASDGVTVLKRVETNWTQRPGATWWNTYQLGPEPANNPRVTWIKTTLTDVSPNQVSLKSFSYDDTLPFNNQTDVYEYDFGPGTHGSLLRRTHTDYVTSANYVGTDAMAVYAGTAAHLRALPSQQWVSADEAGEVKQSFTTYEYDNYTPNATHALLTARTDISGLCTTFGGVGQYNTCSNLNATAYTTRGNLTSVTSYTDAANPTAANAVTVAMQYDVAGNMVKFLDARSIASQQYYATTINYTDCFGAPNGEARTNDSATYSPELFAQSQRSYALATSVTNPLGQTVYSQYSYYLGTPVEAEDVNGVVASAYYNDPLDRPTQVIMANNIPALRQQKTFSYGYDEANLIITVTSDLHAYNDNLLKSQTFHDGLGRVTETRTYESATVYASTKQIPFGVELDTSTGIWRTVSKVSNPYRPQLGEEPAWTTTMKDSLGRVVLVKTADDAAVKTEYGGERMLVTDQAGKKRLSRTNMLGQLTDVWEITPADNATESISFPGHNGLAGYRTSYAYDALANLRKVEQGVQRRYFFYDSLSRLLYARNPEQGVIANLNVNGGTLADGNSQWSLKYTYDNSGNLATKTDSRNVTATYGYDVLNRNTSITYSDGTPSVTRLYDSAINGKGKLWQSETGGATGTRVTVDSYDALGKPLIQKQQFRTGSAWSKNYTVQRTYGLAGQVASQIYPSGHVINYDYYADGRLKEFKGNLGDGVLRGYASGISYDPAGKMREEKYGTLTPLYHKLRYNVRGQLFDVRLSTMSRAQSETDWNRGCLAFSYSNQNPTLGQSAPDNNGNLLKSETYVPMIDGGYYQAVDIYAYDALNRLDSMTELPFLNGQAQTGFTQDYEYDRYGNRKIKEATTTATVNRQQFEVETATNRLMAPGDLALAMEQRRMRHDNAGNLTFDSYTGTGARTYDAESRMIAAAETSGQTSTYTYDADGSRVRRHNISQGEVWQVYGMDGELLAEYGANITSFIPKKEYGYRSGQLLVTASNGDEQRLRRFIQQIYRGTLGREATEADVQHWFEWLADQAVVGNSALLAGAKMMAAYLLDSPECYNRNRTDRQLVQDLYWTYFGRSASQSEEDMWAGRLAPGSPNPITRAELRTVCENWGEFNTQVTALWGGNTTGENERTEHFLWNAYLGAVGAAPSQSIMQPHINALNAAAAQGEETVITTAREIARARFEDPAYALRNRTDSEYVADLYQVFWQRVPDQSGWDYWTNEVLLRGRETVLARFSTSTAFREVASTLYRETLWLIQDHLGTMRMIAERTGSLSGIKRNDYLPFGEEIMASVGGRAPNQGYLQLNGNRKKWAQLERDNETGLDFAKARYYSNTHGRFSTPDPTLLSLRATNPQTLNRYTYVLNNPLHYVDPEGLWELEERRVEEKGKVRVELRIKKSREGDNAARLVEQLGFDPESKEGQKLAANIDKVLQGGDNLQGSKLDGMVGRVFKAAEMGLTEQARFDARYPERAANGEGPANSSYNDCSMTTIRIAFPMQLAGIYHSGPGGPFGIPQAEALMQGLESVSPDALRTGDIVRQADARNTPKHFMTAIFTGDDGVTKAFSRSGTNGRFHIVPVDALVGTYGAIKGRGGKETGFYRPPQ